MGTQRNSAPLICPGHFRPVPDISFSKVIEDGFYLISACLDKNPMLRDGMTGDWIGTFEGHKGAVWCARLNAPATRAVTGSADFSARLWDATTGESLCEFPHKHIVKSVAFNEADTHILTGGKEKILRIWDITAPENPLVELTGHEGAIESAFWLDEHSILSAGADSCLRLFDTRTGAIAKNLEVGESVRSMQMGHDSSIVTIGAGNQALFFDSKTHDFTGKHTFDYPVGSVSLHKDGHRFLVGGHDFWVHVFDIDGKELDVLQGHHGPVHAVQYAPDGEIFASAGEDGTVRLWQNEVKAYGLWQLPLSAEERERQREEAARERERRKEVERERRNSQRKQRDERERSRKKQRDSVEGEGALGQSPPAAGVPESADQKSRRKKRTQSGFNPNAANFTPSFSPPTTAPPVDPAIAGIGMPIPAPVPVPGGGYPPMDPGYPYAYAQIPYTHGLPLQPPVAFPQPPQQHPQHPQRAYE